MVNVFDNFIRLYLISQILISLGSYSGNLGLLQRKEALMYLKSEPAIVDEKWLKLSFPVRAEK